MWLVKLGLFRFVFIGIELGIGVEFFVCIEIVISPVMSTEKCYLCHPEPGSLKASATFNDGGL